ncbi:MAG: transposase [Flavobacteriales bacterium]|nr:transposase [Flavobacteriales bacterium]
MRKHQRIYDLLLSIDGVGPVLAAHPLALTEGFLRFKTARELSCHAGCAPFEHSPAAASVARPVCPPGAIHLEVPAAHGGRGVTARKGELQ